jgi:hypothetical protein
MIEVIQVFLPVFSGVSHPAGRTGRNICIISSLRDLIVDVKQHSRIYCHMKTTIDLPDEILERTKIAAAKRRTSIKNLVIEGLERVLREETPPAPPAEALARLQQGYHLGGKPLTRDQNHAR